MMNSGGAHCLKYGVTANNLLGLKFVTIEGEVIEIGGAHLDAAGYDWLGLITGSEGQLGIVTEVTVRILRGPEGARAMLAAFKGTEIAGAAVDAIIGSGIIPVALEFMDKPCIHACEAFAHAGYPLDAEAMLIIEVEGSVAEQDDLLGRIKEICEPLRPDQPEGRRDRRGIPGDLEGPQGRLRRGRPHQPRLSLHGRHHPDRRAAACAEAHRRDERRSTACKVANVFHAGDGNLHPLIMFDANDPDSFRKAEAFGADILKLCVEVGGCLTGEHGVGVEKRDLMTRAVHRAPSSTSSARIKTAFDPHWLLNPAKVFPLEEHPVRAMAAE